MFYFFQKGQDYLRCEMRARDDGTYELLIQEPKMAERAERFPTSQEAQRRWEELQQRFVGDGWFGPYGRE
jgi:hypothetical protein